MLIEVNSLHNIKYLDLEPDLDIANLIHDENNVTSYRHKNIHAVSECSHYLTHIVEL